MASTFVIGFRSSSRVRWARSILLSIVLAVALCPSVVVAADAAKGEDVGQDVTELPVVAIDSPNIKKGDLESVVKSLGLAIGSHIDGKRLDEGIRALQAKGTYQDVFVEASRTSGGILVSVRAERLRKIRQVLFVNGDSKILDDVRASIDWDDGRTVDMRVLDSLKDRLKAAYQSRGFYKVHIDIKFIDVPNSSESDAQFVIDAHEPTTVGSISVVGASPEENAAMKKQVKLRVGGVFSRDLLDESIVKINEYLQANQYPTSKVEGSNVDFNTDQSQVVVGISVKMNGRFQFQFEGNYVFDDVDLRELLTEEVLSQADFSQKIAESIEKKYRTIGYHFCKVRTRSVQRDQDKLNIVRFDIDEGPKVIIDAIHFNGSLGHYSESELRSLFYDNASGVLSRGVYWDGGMEDSVRALRTRLQEAGYLNVSLNTPRVVFSQDRKGVDIFFDLECGTRTLVGDIDIHGVTQLSKEQVIATLDLKKDSPFNKDRVLEAKKRLVARYQSMGYADMRFALVDGKEVDYLISRDSKYAAIEVDVVEGPKYLVGSVKLEGNKKTKDKVILREMQIKEGDVYDGTKVRLSEEKVSTLGIFNRVEIVPTTDPKQTEKKDLKVIVRETKPGLGEVGFGGFYEDPFLRLRSFLSLAYKNVGGLNQTASARTELSLPLQRTGTLIPFVEYSGVLGYRAPYPFEIPVVFTGQVIFDSYEVSNLDSGIVIQTRTKVQGKIEKKLSSKVTGLYRIYQFERTRTEFLNQPGSSVVDVIGSTGPGIIVDLRNDPYNPSWGSYHTLNLELSSPLLLSQNNSFVMALSRNSFYFPLLPNTVLALYAGFAWAQTLVPGEGLPAARLANDLALGGSGSIRGFNLNQFTALVTDPNNPTVIIGPPVQNTGYYNFRAEITMPLFSGIGGALFYDTGEIFPNGSPQGRNDGIGFGFRYKTPVGPIVIDLAQGLGPNQQGIKFYFTVGSI